MLILLLLFETMLFGVTKHLPMEAPTVGEVVASCARLAVRLWVAVAIARAVMVGALGAMAAEEWMPHDRGGQARGDLGARAVRGLADPEVPHGPLHRRQSPADGGLRR